MSVAFTIAVVPGTPHLARPRRTLAVILALWAVFYGSSTLFTPALLDDADPVHAEVAREMLLRHDPVTLYANGIRYLEKAPVLYWSMAASMRTAMLFGNETPRALAAAARVPLALTVLLLALLCEAFARRLFGSQRAGLYAALITLSSFGVFLFTRITLPDADICLFLALALYAYMRAEEENSHTNAAIFGAACALGVLSKGLIGLVFPLAIIAAHLLLSRGGRGALRRLRELQAATAALTFFVLAAPWHIAAGLANPTVGTPAPFRFVGGHWQVPLPTFGNVHGWFWFYFMNEHLLRYLNLRVPRDYDTSPLWLFWGLCFVWLMPWSAFAPKAFAWCVRTRDRGKLLLVLWAAVILLFFSLSTRQEYYVLPALPAAAIAIGGWLAQADLQRAAERCTLVLTVLGAIFAAAAIYLLAHTTTPARGTDLATLLTQNPGSYALSMGHFLDLDTRAMGLFRFPLALAAVALFLGPLASLLLRRRNRAHAANVALAVGAFGFLLAAHLGLRTFAPVLSSAQLAEQIAPQVHPADLIVLHGEYEAGSTLGFYLKRADLHIIEGRSSNLWYGSFFPDAPPIFETPDTLAAKWHTPQRIFLWQSTTDSDAPTKLPPGLAPVYVLAQSGGKEIISNQPNP